jgi:hypothetical protein
MVPATASEETTTGTNGARATPDEDGSADPVS